MKNFSSKKNSASKPAKKEKIFANKSFGQNFLTDENIISEIVSALNAQENETIFEIGPGRGALTEKLLQAGAKVVAIEVEREMIRVLQGKFEAEENFVLIEADVLKCDFKALRERFTDSKIKLVANLPYYISTAILQKLIEQRAEFAEMVLMFQREVVERLTAEPGESERGFLTVLAQTYLHIEKLFDVSPNSFFPAPKVWSSVARLTSGTEAEISDEVFYKSLISQAFQQKRKTLWNNLKNFQPENFSKEWKDIFEQSHVAPERRAESLTISEWEKLFEAAYLNE